MAGPWARLCAAFFLIGLAASRLTLVLHELAGHGGMAALLGSRLVAYRLFLFGGGWVSYEWSPGRSVAAAVAVSLAGIALEIAAAAAALLVAARRGRAALTRVALVGFATAVLIHAGFYLAAGTLDGFGDGRVLHDEMGAARAALVWPLAAAVMVAGLLLSRHLARLTGGWLGAHSRSGRAAGLMSAVAVATLAHGGLTLSERVLAADATYSRIMKTDSQRQVEREMARLAERARGRGALLDERALAAWRSELERRHRRFPLTPVLACALALACAVGVWLGVGGRGSRPAPADPAGPRAPPSWRALAPLAAVTAAALALVALLDTIA